MKQIRQVLYAAFAVALTTAPVVASADWNSGFQNAQGSQLPRGSIYNIIQSTMNWLLAILGFIGIIGFVIAGILYLTAAGSEEQIEKAKSAMLYSIIGIVVALLGFVIIKAVDTWLQGSASAF